MDKSTIAVFHTTSHGNVCECGFGYGTAYNWEIEMEHRIEHLEGKWQKKEKEEYGYEQE